MDHDKRNSNVRCFQPNQNRSIFYTRENMANEKTNIYSLRKIPKVDSFPKFCKVEGATGEKHTPKSERLQPKYFLNLPLGHPWVCAISIKYLFFNLYFLMT